MLPPARLVAFTPLPSREPSIGTAIGTAPDPARLVLLRVLGGEGCRDCSAFARALLNPTRRHPVQRT